MFSVVPSGCSARFLLREAVLPAVLLEHSGWLAGVCVFVGRSGLHRLRRRKQDPGSASSPSSSTHAPPSEVDAPSRFDCERSFSHYRWVSTYLAF